MSITELGRAADAADATCEKRHIELLAAEAELYEFDMKMHKDRMDVISKANTEKLAFLDARRLSHEASRTIIDKLRSDLGDGK